MPWIFLSSLILTISFPNIFDVHGFWPAAWVFAIPLFYVLEGQSLLKRIFWGFFWGILTYGLLVNWVGQVHWLGYTLLVVALSLQPIIFAALFVPLKNKYWATFYYPAAWVVSEFARMLAFDGFSWGIAHSQTYEPPIIQLASITGSWGVAFLLIFVNSCLYFAIRKTDARKTFLLLAAAFFAANFACGSFVFNYIQSSDSMARVVAIQPNIPPAEKHAPQRIDENFLKQYDLSHSCAAQSRPDIVLWPETAYPDDVLRNPEVFSLLSETARADQTAFIVGSALSQEEKNFNSAVYIDREGRTQGIYHKQHLVPLSESPLLGRMSRLFGGYGFSKGKSLGLFTLFGQVHFGVAICSEGSYPKMFRDLKNKGARFVTIILNDAWFKSVSALMMHAQHEIMRAVEVRMPIVRGSNSGLTCLNLPWGEVEASAVALQTKGCGVFDVPVARLQSFYAKFGDFFAVLCLVFVIIILIFRKPHTPGIS